MFFFQHNLIMMTILVIAISVTTAMDTMNQIMVRDARNFCKTILTLYCGFRNNETDYITSNSNAAFYNPAPENLSGSLERMFTQLGTATNLIPHSGDQALILIKREAEGYLQYITYHAIQSLGDDFKNIYYRTLRDNEDFALRFTVAMYNYLRYPDIQELFTSFQYGASESIRSLTLENQVSEFMKNFRSRFTQRDHPSLINLWDTPVDVYCAAHIIPTDYTNYFIRFVTPPLINFL